MAHNVFMREKHEEVVGDWLLVNVKHVRPWMTACLSTYSELKDLLPQLKPETVIASAVADIVSIETGISRPELDWIDWQFVKQFSGKIT